MFQTMGSEITRNINPFAAQATSAATSAVTNLVTQATAVATDVARSGMDLIEGNFEDDSDDPDLGAAGDPLQAEDLETQNHTMMASHVKDMLVIYDRKPEDPELEREEERARSQGPFQRKCRRVLKNGRFDCFFCFLILVDAGLIALSVDSEEEGTTLLILLYLISFGFLVELIVRIIAEPWKIREPLLQFDAALVIVSIAEAVARYLDMPIDIIFFRAFRIFRLMRIIVMTRVARRLPPLQLLIDAISKSVQPLVIVLLLSGILVFAFSVMMTNMVPEAIEDGDDEVREVVLRHYGSVGLSARSFLEVIDGSSSCSIDSMMILYRAAQDGRQGSAVIIISRLLASFVLFLALSGLVTGVFIEQLCGATHRVEERAHQQELLKSHECLSMIDQVFASMGFSCDDPITWREIERGFESNTFIQERLDLTLKDVRRLFLHLDDDGDGSVATDEFIFGIFKLKTISKSMDMLSIDYQQEKALQRLSDLHSSLRLSIAGIQSRLAAFAGLLPEMENNISSVTKGIDEVQKLEEDLMLAHKSRQEASKDGIMKSKESQPALLNIETLRSNYHLNGKLTALEEEFTRLQDSEARGVPTAQEQEEAVNAIADGIVQSIKRTLEEELTAMRGDHAAA